jgi:glycosyltransferase involved in cell wall biosynthesis
MAHDYNKIILTLMIKNESKIIERCMSNALPYVDAINILDTGSTDNTVEICESYLSTCGKPYKISVEPFQNFGYNRTISFQKAQELCKELRWDPEITYSLAVDADMVIKPGSEFRSFQLTLPGYHAIQKNGLLSYFNSRFMKCAYNWKCVGVTHEYWSGDPSGKVPLEVFYIEDVNDGGCKSDKFERDIRLLTEDLQRDPKNGRSYFYLAQSLKDIGRFREAIENYKKRIEIGGWEEEVWYAFYQIGKCYHAMGNIEKLESWMLKAWKRRPWRAEPLYYLVNYFRLTADHYKAYSYYMKGKDIPYPKDDLLFVEHSVYNGLFDYENTILACYVNGKTKQDALGDVVSYINKNIQHNVSNVWDNMHFYIEPLDSHTYKGEYTKLFFPFYEEYQVSSCCVVPYNGRFLMNTRYVNYSIDKQGCYHMRSPDNKVKTKNGMVYLNSSYYPVEDVTIMKEEPDHAYSSNIEGLEDVRLFFFQNQLRFTASSKNLTDDGRIHIVSGDYRPETAVMNNIRVLQPPRPSDCEKNWVYVPPSALRDSMEAKDKMNFIYSWHPLEIGAVDEHNKLDIHTRYDTPTIFSRFRGSSTICEYDEKLWAVVHFVKYSTPRVYYHSLVQFNRDTMQPEMYSYPFCFRKLAIEYCLGLHIRDGQACFIFSQNDNEPGMISMPITNLRFFKI